MTHALITIGITCYNAEDIICAAIDSALAQDWPNIEIIVVDDASTDNSVAVVQEKLAGDERFQLIEHKENKGVATARNEIINSSTGEFIAFFDDDDQSTPDRLAKQYARVIAYERDFAAGASVVCHTARTQVFSDSTERYEQTMGTEEGRIAPHGKAVAERVLTGRLIKNGVGSIATCSQMARRQTYLDLGNFDESLTRMEDTDFSIRLALAGGHFVGIAEPLVIQSMTRGHEKTLDAEYEAWCALLEKHRAYLEKTGWYGFAREWIDIRFADLRKEQGGMFSGLLKLFLKHPVKLMLKIIWAIPAHSTRRAQKKWYHDEKAE